MMETIRVNMTPCEDIKTIHASQNDNEAREWGFELHNNGDKIDSSSISDQLVFKAYEGGTEQILPENGSTPTTSPFIGDIKYPQGLLSDQEFLYRESPTEEDGLAKIKSIKGNTLVWNQLVQNGNFMSTSSWYQNGAVTFTVSNNKATVICQQWRGIYQQVSAVSNHKYLMVATCKQSGTSTAQMIFREKDTNQATIANTSVDITNSETTLYIINQCQSNTAVIQMLFQNNGADEKTIEIKNAMLIDLTQIGLDISSPSEFTSLFNIPYYSYNQGTLLSFNGNGIKTVGKNLCTRTTTSNIYNAGNLIPVKSGDVLYYGGVWTGTGPSMWGAVYASKDETNKNNYLKDYNWVRSGDITSVTIDRDGFFGVAYSGGVGTYNVEKMMISFVPFTMSEYEPYTSSTLSLPISTYFTNGMKSAGSVYDEKTNSSYVERTKYIKFDGSQPWSTRTTSGGYVLYEYVPLDIKNVGTQATAQISNNLYPWNTNLGENKTIRQVNTTITVRRDDITSLQAWYSELASNPLEIVYQLATPIETEITTASLVTENGEIPLSNEDGTLIGKCTEQLSSESGFFDAKIKLADEDGECYSNKIQLHVERSPQ